MKTRATTHALLMLTLLGTVSCTRRLDPEPLPVDRGQCARCGMLISSDATGAEIVSTDAAPRFYDDIGCLAADAAAIAPGTRAFVKSSDGWLEIDAASFARSNTNTPMGSGLLAYADADQARAVDRERRALSWSDVTRVAGSAGGHP